MQEMRINQPQRHRDLIRFLNKLPASVPQELILINVNIYSIFSIKTFDYLSVALCLSASVVQRNDMRLKQIPAQCAEIDFCPVPI